MLKLIKRVMGGCVSNKAVLIENSFRVTLAEESTFNILSSGNLFITSIDIQYYPDDQIEAAFTWPLKYIRRYGHEKKVFRFEAGRKCPKGEGNFSFITNRAEKVFNSVELSLTRGDRIVKQQGIDRSISSTASRRPLNGTTTSPLTTVASSGISERTVSTSSSENSPKRHIVHNSTFDGAENQPKYVNVDTDKFSINSTTTSSNMQFKKSPGISPTFNRTKIAPLGKNEYNITNNIPQTNNVHGQYYAFTKKENYVTCEQSEECNTYINASRPTYVALEFGPESTNSSTPVKNNKTKNSLTISDYTELDYNTTDALRETIYQEQERKSFSGNI